MLLLDEIEKAHQDIFNTLLQVMDYATLTDNTGKKADFRNVIIIMTSNAGAREIGKAQVGFEERKVTRNGHQGRGGPHLFARVPQPARRGREVQRPDEEIIVQIVKKTIDLFRPAARGKERHPRGDRRVLPVARRRRATRPKFGAREIDRLVQDKIKKFFVDEVLFGRLAGGGTAVADIVDDDVAIRVEERVS